MNERTKKERKTGRKNENGNSERKKETVNVSCFVGPYLITVKSHRLSESRYFPLPSLFIINPSYISS